MINIEEQKDNIDNFIEELINAVMVEGLSMGIPFEQQEQARIALKALGNAAKSVVGKVSPGMFASALLTYGEALQDANRSDDDDDDDEEGGRQVFEHIDESIDTDEGGK